MAAHYLRPNCYQEKWRTRRNEEYNLSIALRQEITKEQDTSAKYSFSAVTAL